ncbi:MAG: hypothetical protein ACRDTC_26495 [Pseudonocardiaceae bacterium]
MGEGVAEMENTVTTGTRCFPLFGSLAGAIWSEQVCSKQGGDKLAMPAVAGGLRVAVLSGPPVRRLRFCALINPISIELPTIDLMRMSVPEP